MNIQLLSNDPFMNAAMIVSFVLFSFISFLFMTFIFRLLLKKEHSVKGRLQPVTVIIPAYNEEKNLGACLKSLSGSLYDMSLLQIIIVNDGSTDKTSQIAKGFKEKHPELDVLVMQGRHKGKSEALNLGLSKAKNELLLSVDADIVLKTDTVRKLVLPMGDPKVGATNAVATIRRPKGMLEHFQMIEFCMNNLIRTSFARVFRNSIWFFGAVACYRRSAIKKLGGFKKDTLTEDMDICLELYNSNYRILTIEDAMMETSAMPRLSDLFRQRMRWYFGALQSLVKNRNLLKNPSPPVVFLFVNQFWWTLFSFVFFPMTAYSVYYWWPQGALEAAAYLFRWFSFAGPVYVFYKIPEWGLNFLNIFGVMSGVLTMILAVASLAIFKGRWRLRTLVALFFYFPYTIVQNAIIISGVIHYTISRKRYFIA